MGTSSLYKGPKSSVLLPSDFDTEENGMSNEETTEATEDISSDGTLDNEDDYSEEEDDEEEKQQTQHYSFQSAKRNFTKSFGESKSVLNQQ